MISCKLVILDCSLETAHCRMGEKFSEKRKKNIKLCLRRDMHLNSAYIVRFSTWWLFRSDSWFTLQGNNELVPLNHQQHASQRNASLCTNERTLRCALVWNAVRNRNAVKMIWSKMVTSYAWEQYVGVTVGPHFSTLRSILESVVEVGFSEEKKVQCSSKSIYLCIVLRYKVESLKL